MNPTTIELTDLFNKIPRRHTVENVKEIYDYINDYENILITIEAINPFYEKNIHPFFNDLDAVRAAVKKSTDNKASKKSKDNFFDEASVLLKDSIEGVIKMYAQGDREA
jgi:hypothetical protein